MFIFEGLLTLFLYNLREEYSTFSASDQNLGIFITKFYVIDVHDKQKFSRVRCIWSTTEIFRYLLYFI